MIIINKKNYNNHNNDNNNNNKNNGDKQNMAEPERPTNGSTSLTVKRASLIDCQVFLTSLPI